MSDLIDRQAVIDIFDKWLSCGDYNYSERNIMNCAIAEIKGLPSAVKPATIYRKKAKRWKKKYFALKTEIEKAKAEILKNYEKITGVYDENTPEDERPIQKIARNVARGECLEIINKHISGKEEEQ